MEPTKDQKIADAIIGLLGGVKERLYSGDLQLAVDINQWLSKIQSGDTALTPKEPDKEV